jgi:hypothetical protein
VEMQSPPICHNETGTSSAPVSCPIMYVRYERSEVLSLIRKRNQPTTQYVKPPASGSLHGNKHHIPKSFLSDVAPKSAEDFDRNVPYASVVDGHRGRRSEVMFSEPLFRVPP